MDICVNYNNKQTDNLLSLSSTDKTLLLYQPIRREDLRIAVLVHRQLTT